VWLAVLRVRSIPPQGCLPQVYAPPTPRLARGEKTWLACKKAASAVFYAAAASEVMAETAKRCSRCGETGLSDRFPPNSRTRDGLSSWCRRCHAAAVQRWRDQNPKKAASYNLARRVKHEPRPCVQCGEPFVPRRSDTQLCSNLCRWRWSRRHRKRPARQSPPR
jgi:ribosomal protein S27AE